MPLFKGLSNLFKIRIGYDIHRSQYSRSQNLNLRNQYNFLKMEVESWLSHQNTFSNILIKIQMKYFISGVDFDSYFSLYVTMGVKKRGKPKLEPENRGAGSDSGCKKTKNPGPRF